MEVDNIRCTFLLWIQFSYNRPSSPYPPHPTLGRRHVEEAKRWSDGWLNDEVGSGIICHDSRGNLVDGLGNPIKEMVEEEEEQHRDEELRFRLRLKQEQEDIQKWHSAEIIPF
jgi:hypothetical protein